MIGYRPAVRTHRPDDLAPARQSWPARRPRGSSPAPLPTQAAACTSRDALLRSSLNLNDSTASRSRGSHRTSWRAYNTAP